MKTATRKRRESLISDAAMAQEFYGDDFLEKFSDAHRALMIWLTADRATHRHDKASAAARALKGMLDQGWPDPGWTTECRQDFFRFIAELPVEQDAQ
jgi:hypothetical protein